MKFHPDRLARSILQDKVNGEESLRLSMGNGKFLSSTKNVPVMAVSMQ